MTRLPARFYADLIGKPFVEGGRTADGFDCVGAVLLVQARLGRELPDYESSIEAFHRAYDSAAGMLGPCRELRTAEAGCIVLLRGADKPHVGVMIDAWTMFHTTSQRMGGAGTERILAPEWRRLIIGYYLPTGGAA